MKIIKYYFRSDKPVYAQLLTRCLDKNSKLYGMFLVNLKIDLPNRKREALWIDPHKVYIDWIRTFSNKEKE